MVSTKNEMITMQLEIDCTVFKKQLSDFEPRLLKLAKCFGAQNFFEMFGDFISILPCEDVPTVITDRTGQAIKSIAFVSFDIDGFTAALWAKDKADRRLTARTDGHQ